MTFAAPHVLWAALAPLALFAWELTRRRRADPAAVHPKILRAEAGDRGVQFTSSTAPLARARRVRPWLTAGLVLAIVALARPQWGRIEEPVFDQSREIILAVDLSRSMLAQDIKPSRLERSKLLIQSLLEKLSGERVGMIVFAGTAFLQSPLSADYEILREFLPALGPDYLPQGGSNYGALLDAAIQAFAAGGAADRFLIILSDGEATDDSWRAHLEELKKKNIRVIGLGIGTADGAMIPDGKEGFVKDERGAVVLSKLENATLQELVNQTNGAYRDASTWIDLASLLKETVEAGRLGQFMEKNTVRFVERFQWPLALGLWCLLVSLYYEFPVRPKPRDLKLALPPRPATRPPAARDLAATTAALMLLLGLAAAPRTHAAASLAPKPKAAAGASATAPTTAPAPAEPSALGRMVGRLAQGPQPTARDWAEFGRETVNWGSRLHSEQQPVPAGPIQDALAAVDLGEKIDPKTTDWPKLRAELEELLKKPEQNQQDGQNGDKKDDKDQEKSGDGKSDQKDQKDQKQEDQAKDDQQQQSDPKGSSNDQKNSPPRKKNEPFDQNTKPPEESEPKPAESAFGDMKHEDTPPPPPPSDTQKVGGAQEKQDQAPENREPGLAVPLQRLEHVRNQDSPAKLFELMEGDRKAPRKPGKDW